MLHPRRTERLPAAALVVWRVEVTAGCVTLWAVGLLASWVWRESPWVASLALAAGIIVALATITDAAWLLPRRWASYRYAVDPAGISVQHGVMWSRRLVVPACQVLYVEVRQGPLHRLLGLSMLRIGTLGSVHEVGPLAADVAAEIAEQHLEDRVADATL